MKYKTIAVIGLGQFGTTIAKMLASMNHEVLGVDINPEIVQKVSPYVTHAIGLTQLMKRQLKHWL